MPRLLCGSGHFFASTHMKRGGKLNPGKRCPSCSDGSCGNCVKGFIVKRLSTSTKKPKKTTIKSSVIEYRDRRKVFLMKNKRCSVLGPDGQCKSPATEVHHRLGRGRFLNVEETWMAVCSECHHNKIHKETRWAHEMKYLLNRASGIIHPVSQTFLPYKKNV